MTEAEMIHWINTSTYEYLLAKWRFSKVGDPFFCGHVGDHFAATLKRIRLQIGPEEHERISELVGWRRNRKHT